MNPDFEVDTEGLRHDATAVTAFADRITGAAASAPAADPSPRWAATGATTLAADSARRMVRALGQDTTEAASRMTAAAASYQEADARAAARMALATTEIPTTTAPGAARMALDTTDSPTTARPFSKAGAPADIRAAR